jgi:aminoglycoside/choline kinase family phosphotransferase
MLVRYGSERPENRLYAGHARFLERLGVRVPRVLADVPRHRFTLFEDAGRRTLERCVREGAGPRRIRNLYRHVLEMAHILHHRGPAAARQDRLRLMPGFTPALYRWERDLFARHFLTGTLGFSPARIRGMVADLHAAATHLRGTDRSLLHRDLQSANVLFKGRSVCLIDFQGMRFGPAAYDLASLLCDPYAMPGPALQQDLLAFYAGLSPAAGRAAEFFGWAAVQRLAQALGAYGRLAALPGGRVYRLRMRPAADMMLRIIASLPRRLPALEDGLRAARAELPRRNGKAD